VQYSIELTAISMTSRGTYRRSDNTNVDRLGMDDPFQVMESKDARLDHSEYRHRFRVDSCERDACYACQTTIEMRNH